MNTPTTTPRRARGLLAAGLLLCGLAVRAGVAPAAAGHRAWGGFFCEALDDSGLDARDARNRPVRSPQVRAELKDLFTATVFTLLAERPLPLSSLARRVLEDWLAPFGAWLGRAAGEFARAVDAAFAEGRRLSLPLAILFLAVPSLLAGGILRPQRAASARTCLPLDLPLRC